MPAFRSIRHWFFANKHNNFHPHILRPLGLFLVVFVLACIPTLYNVTTAGKVQVLGYATNISAGSLSSYTNQQRANNGLPALGLNGTLSQAAYAKAQHMIAHNYWAHVAPDGTQPWSFISGAGYAYATAGENLAKNFSTYDGVVNAWMGSPSHRANVLSSAFTEAGYAVVNGTLLGEETTLVVAMYAAPKAAAPAPAAAPAKPAPAPAPPPTPAPAPAAPQPAQAAPAQEAAPVEEAPTEASPVKDTNTSEQEAVKEEAVAEPVKVLPQDEGAVAGVAILAAPVKVYQGLNWGQRASIVLLCTVLLLFVMKHTAVWRTRQKSLRHIWLRAHPLAQGSMLFMAISLIIASSTGTIL